MIVAIIIISVYVNINQLRKQETQEDYITELENSNTEYYNFFQSLKTKIGEANSSIKNADRLGAFEASDEIGESFKIIRDVMEDLNRGF